MNKNYQDKEFLEGLPGSVQVSFHKVYEKYLELAKQENHPFQLAYQAIVDKIPENHPLIEGVDNFEDLKKYKQEIALLSKPLFSDVLSDNEIKLLSTPFSTNFFQSSERLDTILSEAGEGFELDFKILDFDEIYRICCIVILRFYYDVKIEVKGSFYFEIPNLAQGITQTYRLLMNVDNIEIILKNLDFELSEADIKLLLNNYEDIALWKNKIPVNTFNFKGIALFNLFDVTQEENLNAVKQLFLSREKDLIPKIEKHLRNYFKLKDLHFGYSVYYKSGKGYRSLLTENQSLFIDKEVYQCENFFCKSIFDKIFIENKTVVLSDIQEQVENSGAFYKMLNTSDYKSLILVPTINNLDYVAVLEIASLNAYDLHTINKSKLDELTPIFQAVVQQIGQEDKYKRESFIQQYYTSLHPTVRWRFDKVAQNYNINTNNNKPTIIEEIKFEKVHPLYGQLDIRGSSVARNTAIRKDVDIQLRTAREIISHLDLSNHLPIYKKVIYQLDVYYQEIRESLDAGMIDKINLFFKEELHPMFDYFIKKTPQIKKMIFAYYEAIDPNVGMVYKERKAYENAVNMINQSLSEYIDKQELEAQKMFPFYFERYKTDGVEFNAYIGQSLVQDKVFSKMYVSNLRLWQLLVMCEMENIAYNLQENMKGEVLRVASLILVHSKPLSIQFRMDEKKFDVDGIYNIRYEILKKRIDKSHIKNTKERLTVPGKIAIVYSNEIDALEYSKYFDYLRSIDYLTSEIEYLELEDLQGVAGLKAMRVAVNYTVKKENVSLGNHFKKMSLN